ncbi:para-nitrobenzyl esterase [Rhizobium sp. BK313]|uniref:carboxylesterase family protein n=1 Tax=Rhizobium sp. BK313 TaxID=2587081 RepID=UPI00105BCF1D|nr:carboxylesterase family protein [Rhizobium sp. BK313]MBB3458743.1 para-nitrobenzyl esterase [Rhizobium sp. BK313]
MTTLPTIDVQSRNAIYRGLRNAAGMSFRGIRYAEPPLGMLRFLPPRRYENQGLVDATRPGLAPAQIRREPQAWSPRGEGFATGEDCLNLNLYTPAADGGKRPVIVHAFGGGFQSGSAHGTFHDDLGFANQSDVVLVRPNMRVGALGFLHLADVMGKNYAATNRGMLDFVAALYWVRRNVAAFGGDPDNVTLVGMSSGAFTISALFGMDEVSDLYRRVWLMSGPASRIIEPDVASAISEHFLMRVGISQGDSVSLNSLPLDTVLTAQEEIVAQHLGERNAPRGRTLGIVLDGESLKRHPLKGLSEGRFSGHQIVAGWTRDEARLWYVNGVMPPVVSRDQLITSISRFAGDDPWARLAALEAELPGRSFTDYEEVFLSRAVYREPALRTAETHASAGGVAYTYEFSWTPIFEGGRLGAAHSFDEPFVFGNVDAERIPLARDDVHARDLARQMNRALRDFCRRGAVDWRPFTAGDKFVQRFE